MSSRDETLSNRDFTRLRSFIYAQSGINLNEDKKTMLELRIKRRLRALSLTSFSAYCDLLFDQQGQKEEIVHFLNVVTTNKTDFFREPDHFEFLVQKALPEIIARKGVESQVIVWSAGCSTGEEPYTLAMVMNEFAQLHAGFHFKVLATDISTTVLEKARMGVFSEDLVRPVAPNLRRKYFMRSRDRASNLVRIVPEMRAKVEFRRLNFKDANYGLSEKVDAIFCRNVIIYFDRATQEQILQKLTQNLLPGGFAFVGHSETLHGMDLPLLPIAPALYRRVDGRP
jgi:chemotaxis protein methyltransferase CheR